MPYANADGVRLYYEEAGSGPPILFVHEFAGDLRSWEPQLRFFSRHHRCIAFNARGYPSSDVPDESAAYSQTIATDDIVAVLRHLELDQAHIVGLSMGAFAALHLGLRFPQRASTLVLAGVGYGALSSDGEQFRAEVEQTASRFEAEGMAAAAASYAATPHRDALRRKDPRGFAEFVERLAQHSTPGSVRTLRGVQKARPFFDRLDSLPALRLPTLVIAGDEDQPSLEPSLYLARMIPAAALSVLPQTGHAINLEQPDRFNALLQDFFTTAASGRWHVRAAGERPRRIL